MKPRAIKSIIERQTGETITLSQSKRLKKAIDRIEVSFWLPFKNSEGGFAEGTVSIATKNKMIIEMNFGIKGSRVHKTIVIINRKTLAFTV